MKTTNGKTITRITLDHGSGGLAAQELVQQVFLSRLQNPILAALEDSAVLPFADQRLAFTTDSYVVEPLFFPGGDIGSLAINGTVNDLAMRGGTTILGLSLALIIEEGLPGEILEQVAASLAAAAAAAGVQVVTGDTKVVPRGAADKLFINTAGVAVIPPGIEISPRQARVGDGIILSGTMADHGITILAERENLGIAGQLRSDCCALNQLVDNLLKLFPAEIHALRDPTRGGVATALCEMAAAAGLELEIDEAEVPMNKNVAMVSEILGLDPFFLANEGKCLLFVAPQAEKEILAALQRHREGREARLIGRATGHGHGRVVLRTAVGGQRRLTPLTGNPLPRIC
ncbi:MAG: hydrogenase expression/formation protein HypE [Deltaproteobacteria bacterium]|nr:hydrogenase expression/formation protein HypE [Deltaproteobacteria bacterium]